MTSDAATGPAFDPRFDPRFQRGYSGQGAQQAGPPTADGAPQAEPAVTAPSASSDHEAAMSGESVSVADPPAPADGGVDEIASVDPKPDEPGTDRVAREDHRQERNEEPARLWMLTAWAIALACIVVGFGLFWAANDAVSYVYVGIPTAEEQLLQALGWWLAPPLVEGGVIGVISLLVIGGIRRAQRAGRRTDRG